MKTLIVLCFFNFAAGGFIGILATKDFSDGSYDAYPIHRLDTGKQCPEEVKPRVISIVHGGLIGGHHGCAESTDWSEDFHRADSVYLCQSPSMIDVKIIESVSWDQSRMIGIGTVEIYHYDESNNEVCYSKVVTNWVKR